MPVVHLTRRTIKALPAPDGPTVYRDSELAGFTLTLRPSGASSWSVEYRPGAGGRGVATRRVKLGDTASLTVEQARTMARDLLAGVRLGKDPARERQGAREELTVQELLDAWLRRHVATKLKPRTAEAYKSLVTVHIAPALGKKRVSEVGRSDVAQLVEAVAGKIAGARRGKSSEARGGHVAANRVLATVKAAWNWGEAVGLLPEGAVNPARRVAGFKERGRERFLTMEEMGRLGEGLTLAETVGLPWIAEDDAKPTSKHSRKPENRLTKYDEHSVAAVRLLLTSGMRVGEVLSLEWSQVDWERGVLRLPDSKTGQKTVVLGAPALAVLQGLKRIGRFVIAGQKAGTKEEKPRRDLKRIWGALCHHAGLEGVRVHDMRHSFASVGVGGGEGLPIIGKLLGHRVAATTARYAHVAHDPERRAADAISGAVAKALGMAGADVVDLETRRARG